MLTLSALETLQAHAYEKINTTRYSADDLRDLTQRGMINQTNRLLIDPVDEFQLGGRDAARSQIDLGRPEPKHRVLRGSLSDLPGWREGRPSSW